MQLDASRLAIALGATTAIFWTVCSALVAVLSGPMATMSGHMFHLNAMEFAWNMTFPGFLAGLVAWTLCAVFAGLLIAWIYNATSDTVGRP